MLGELHLSHSGQALRMFKLRDGDGCWIFVVGSGNTLRLGLLSAVLGGAGACVVDSSGLPTWDPRAPLAPGLEVLFWWLALCRSSCWGEQR